LGHIRAANIIYARSDSEALKKAREMSHTQSFEVWESGRFVGRHFAGNIAAPPDISTALDHRQCGFPGSHINN
jgi:hypothetical protein